MHTCSYTIDNRYAILSMATHTQRRAKNNDLEHSSDESSKGSGGPWLKPNERSKIRRGLQYHYQHNWTITVEG